VRRLNGVTVGRAGDLAAPCQAVGLSPARWTRGRREEPGPRLSCRPAEGMALVADPQQLPAAVIALPAEIDMANADRVGQQLGAAFTSGVRTVIADMTATRFCDSSGINMLVRAYQQAAAHGTELRLVVPSTAVLRTLTLLGLDDLLPIYPSLSQGLAAAPGPGPETRHD
jgi:anti-anti-sigma factor